MFLAEFKGLQKETGERGARVLQKKGDEGHSQLEKGEGEVGCRSQGDPRVPKERARVEGECGSRRFPIFKGEDAGPWRFGGIHPWF